MEGAQNFCNKLTFLCLLFLLCWLLLEYRTRFSYYLVGRYADAMATDFNKLTPGQ